MKRAHLVASAVVFVMSGVGLGARQGNPVLEPDDLDDR